MSNVFATYLGIWLWVALPTLYWVPTIVAASRGHQKKWSIILVNAFTGWTVFGWVGALIWAIN